MIAVVGASVGPLLAPLVARYRDLDDVELWNPRAAPAWLARLPLGFVARRRAASTVRAPAVFAADVALRAWARAHTDRRYLSDFALRVAIDAWAARVVRERRPDIVVAPSLAARRTFAAARGIGAQTVLVLDLPLLRALHRDLDRAAAVWPERRFLRRFRAPAWAIARQEAERVLADRIVVRGGYARAECVADGLTAASIELLPAPARPSLIAPAAPTGRVRLAGIAAARHGIDTALAAAALAGKTLVVRTGEGTEPADVLSRSGVVADDGPVDAIICPAVCETYPPELRAIGIPVIASRMASLDGEGLDPFDAAAFAAAITGR